MLEIKNLTVSTDDKKVILNNISLVVPESGAFGLTGASGSGKTTLIKSIMGILGAGCHITSGEILINGKNILQLNMKKHRKLCGTTLGFIPQNPMTAFFHQNKIGSQMCETFIHKLNISKQDSLKLARRTLRNANLLDTERILHSYPNQISGGMLQRVSFAILMGLKPKYILADEPTSALDEENRVHLISLLKQCENTGILFISHDTEALKALCSETMVMEEGIITEKNKTSKLFEMPQRNWTKLFVRASTVKEGDEWQWTELK